MSVKIDNREISTTRPLAAALTAKPAAGDSNDKALSPVASVGRVQLTGNAVSLHQVDQQLSASAASDSSARVQKLRAAIADGSYSPNPAAIAAKLERFEWDLSSR